MIVSARGFKDHLARFAIRDFGCIYDARASVRRNHEAIDQHKHWLFEIDFEQRLRRREFENLVLLVKTIEAALA